MEDRSEPRYVLMSERLAYKQPEAAEALDMGVKHFDKHVRPHVRAVYVDGLTLYPRSELERFLDRNLA